MKPEDVDGELVDDAVDAWHDMPRPALLDDQMRFILVAVLPGYEKQLRAERDAVERAGHAESESKRLRDFFHAMTEQRDALKEANDDLDDLIRTERAQHEATIVERDALKAAIERVKELRDQWVLASMPADTPLGWPSPAAAYADVVAWLDAALAAPESAEDAPMPCPRCEGSMVEPGTGAEGDWDSAAMRHHPYTGEPCTACNGTGKAAGWLDRLAAASLAAAREKFGPETTPDVREETGRG